jgi:hypothetical protein
MGVAGRGNTDPLDRHGWSFHHLLQPPDEIIRRDDPHAAHAPKAAIPSVGRLAWFECWYERQGSGISVVAPRVQVAAAHRSVLTIMNGEPASPRSFRRIGASHQQLIGNQWTYRRNKTLAPPL